MQLHSLEVTLVHFTETSNGGFEIFHHKCSLNRIRQVSKKKLALGSFLKHQVNSANFTKEREVATQRWVSTIE